jgi:transposase
MAGKIGDSEQRRQIDRIMAVAFRLARDDGANFINRKWVAEKLGRSMQWVTDNWNKSPQECSTQFGEGRPQQLSQESRNIVAESSNKQRKSHRQVAQEILQRRGKRVTHMTVFNYRQREGLKPFHVIARPLKTQTHIEDRLWLCDWLSEWDEEDFLHLAPSDEFFVYAIRKPNFQNDRIWAKSIDDISEDERYRDIVRNPTCIGIFVMFTAKKLMWVLKEKGESWDGGYFREKILAERVIPFLNDPENVLLVGEAIFLHDKAPCMRAKATQHLLKQNGVDFWGNDIWPGNSPDLNPAEHIGAIIKDEVEAKMIQEHGPGRYSVETLKKNLIEVLESLEDKTELFENLLCSYPSRLKAVRDARGQHTDY